MKVFTAVFFLFAALIAPGCYRQNAEPEPPAPKVEGDRLTLSDAGRIAASISSQPSVKIGATPQIFNGRLLWNDDVTVRVFTPFSGRVTKVLVNAGEHVERETPLALIASPDFGQAQSDARRAESDFSQAERTVNRLRELFDHGAAAKKDLDSAEADLARVRSERERTASRLQFYGGSSSGVDQIYPLKSPLAGIVVEKNINPGQEVRPDQILANAPQFFTPLFVVTDPSRLWVQLDVAENDLRLLKRGQGIIIRSQGLPDDNFAGRVDNISESLDPATHTVKVRGSVDNPGRKLKAEMFVTVELPGAGPSELQVPSKAIFLRGNRHFLFIEEKPGIYRRREVKVGDEQGGRVAVVNGISPGDRVVSEGSLLLEQMFQKAFGS
jgi:cobalt-zinc-cadmium efflux system membrane fusion protein